MSKHFTFNAAQIETIIDRVVPLVANEDDHEFFKGVLFCKAESCKTSGEFAMFIKSMLELAGEAA